MIVTLEPIVRKEVSFQDIQIGSCFVLANLYENQKLDTGNIFLKVDRDRSYNFSTQSSYCMLDGCFGHVCIEFEITGMSLKEL